MAPELYQPIYLLIVTILTYITCQRYSVWYSDEEERNAAVSQPRYAGMLAIFMTFFIGLRPIRGHFVDMWNYKVDYMTFNYGKPFKFTWDTDNFLFDNLMSWLGSNRVDITYFFLFVAVIYFGLMFLACRKLFPNDTLLSFLVYLGALSTFSYGTNGIKAGAAASIFLLALAYRDVWWKAGIFLILSLGFHHSMAAPIAIFIIAYFVKERKYFLLIWIVALIMAALHITFFQEIFAGLTDEQGAGYLQVTDKIRAVSGFRPDFILYSAIPIFLGNYIMQKYEIESDEYDFLWNVYTLTNAIFLLCSYGSFINRIAYLSWLMYPFVLIYPFLKADLGYYQNRYLQYVVFGHLGFTLFMDFIYYGI